MHLSHRLQIAALLVTSNQNGFVGRKDIPMLNNVSVSLRWWVVLVLGLSLSSWVAVWADDESASSLFRNGVNLQPSYYNNGQPNFGWNLMANYNAKIRTVRIEIEPSATAHAKSWIAAARSHGYFVVATYHDYTKLGSDNPQDLKTAANWWVKNYASITDGNATNFVINVMNEWGSHTLPAGSYADAYNDAIGLIRQVYKGYIIADLPGWGQEFQTAAKASSQIHDAQVMFSAHLYPTAWNNNEGRYVQPQDLDDLSKTGRPCIVGEFGTGGSGSADVSSLVQHAKSLHWTVLGWAWNGDGTGMNMVSPAWSDNPTASSFTINSNYFNTIYDLL